MADHVTFTYRRTFPYPVDVAYQWLTDYQDDDGERTTAIVKRRPVIAREGNKVVLEGHLEIMGRQMQGTATVHLFPPDRWEAHLHFKNGRGTVYRYRLDPLPGGRQCRLTAEYEIPARRWTSRLKLHLARPLVMREIDTMWDGFAKSMEKELGAAPTP